MRLLFVGDINLGEYYLTFGHGPRTRLHSKDILEGVKDIFDGADIIAGNLEASLTNNDYDTADPERCVLRGAPKHASYLKKAGFNVLQIANNHTVQHGKAGFDETVHVLEQNGIAVAGLNKQAVKIVEVEGKKVGFFAASDVPDNTDKQQQSYQRLNDTLIQKIKQSVSQVDYLFVMFHWGLEESTVTMDYQKQLIDELVDAGVTGVIGSHPHLFYEIWKQKHAIVAPSLGNFVFDLCWDKRLLQTGILDVTIDSNGVQAKVWPVKITEYGAVPVISGVAQEVKDSVKLYDLGSKMDKQAFRKIIYFLRHFLKGHRNLKLKFIASKVINNLPILKSLRRTARI
jgi:poly-gamma-glutamate synthesis protein (capsule biosynthesis protein)